MWLFAGGGDTSYETIRRCEQHGTFWEDEDPRKTDEGVGEKAIQGT
jgi:hypothetical protein